MKSREIVPPLGERTVADGHSSAARLPRKARETARPKADFSKHDQCVAKKCQLARTLGERTLAGGRCWKHGARLLEDRVFQDRSGRYQKQPIRGHPRRENLRGRTPQARLVCLARPARRPACSKTEFFKLDQGVAKKVPISPRPRRENLRGWTLPTLTKPFGAGPLACAPL